MAATKNVCFSNIADSFVKRGDFREQNKGEHPLMAVDPSLIVRALDGARKKGDGFVWAVIAVLLRLKFGDFVYRDRRESALLEIEEKALDDVEFSVQAIRRLLRDYGANLSSLTTLFDGSRALKSAVFSNATKQGWKDQVAVSILAFLRDNNGSIPSSLGDGPEHREIVPILVPLLWEMFGLANGAFVTGNERVIKVLGGRIAGHNFSIAETSALKWSSRYLVLGDIETYPNGERFLTFGASVIFDPSQAELRSTCEGNFVDLYLHKAQAQEMRLNARMIAEKAQDPAPSVLPNPVEPKKKRQSPEELVAAILAAASILKGNLSFAMSSLEAKKEELAVNQALEQEEVARHQHNIQRILGERHDLVSDVSSLEKQVKELSASEKRVRDSLSQLGITHPN